MALVDYSSSDSTEDGGNSSSSAGSPPTKRRRDGVHKPDKNNGHDAAGNRLKKKANGKGVVGPSNKNDKGKSSLASDMPPLPDAFHDLYASTVRQSVVDDPSLHHGRKRQTPHVAGNWPSHLYIEWHPNTAQHGVLRNLFGEIEKLLGSEIELHSFLSSDLGAPMPLHISLSRPLTLSTSQKDEFLDKLKLSIRDSGRTAFPLRPLGLAWYKSPDSDRTFLILRVTSADPDNRPEDEREHAINTELMSLLTRCNTVATTYNQPALYQQTQKEQVGNAFHVSIGWTFGLPGDELSLQTLRLFKDKKFAEMRRWKVDVSGVKVKIGNVVTNVPLTGRKDASRGTFDQ